MSKEIVKAIDNLSKVLEKILDRLEYIDCTIHNVEKTIYSSINTNNIVEKLDDFKISLAISIAGIEDSIDDINRVKNNV